jgi:hypothetical protein
MGVATTQRDRSDAAVLFREPVATSTVSNLLPHLAYRVARRRLTSMAIVEGEPPVVYATTNGHTLCEPMGGEPELGSMVGLRWPVVNTMLGAARCAGT